jgi:hypothetical protein
VFYSKIPVRWSSLIELFHDGANVTFTGDPNRGLMMKISALTEKKSLELKKHVGLIHSTNRLTLLERKISNALLYNAYDKLLAESEHQMHIPSLCVLIGYNSKDYKTIRKSLLSLISTVLEWNLVDKNQSEGEGVWMASSMLADAKIEGPICTYSYSNRMRELCHYPEFYGRLNMHVLAQFKSTYGLALYENCIRYQSITQTPWFDLPTYRKLMGVADGKYETFRDLNKRVIKPSVAEVNNHASINVKSELKKQGRVVVAVRFLINNQVDKTTIAQIEKSETEKTIVARLGGDYGFSEKQLGGVINQYSEQYLLEKMALVESSLSYRSGKIEHLSKYLEKALVEDYQPPKSSKESLVNLQIKRDEEAKIRKLHEANMQKYRSYQNHELPDVLNSLPNKKKISIEKDFDKYISSTLYYSVYIKHGLEDPLVRDRFGDFIRTTYSELLASLLSFEEYCKRFNS